MPPDLPALAACVNGGKKTSSKMAGKIFFGRWNRKRQMGERCDFPGILRLAKAAPPAAMQLMRTDATPEPADTAPVFSPARNRRMITVWHVRRHAHASLSQKQ